MYVNPKPGRNWAERLQDAARRDANRAGDSQGC